jgi:predicted DNA-binding protein (MmcQ/YjbR family)
MTTLRPRPARAARPAKTPSPLARLRELCLALPEANEKLSHGEPTWFAGKGKVFAMLDDHHHGAAHLAVWLPQPLGRQEDLIDADPDRFFRPPYVGPSGWVGLVLDDDPDWGMVASLIEDAYRFVARPKLVAQLDGAPPAPRKRRGRPRSRPARRRPGSPGSL